MSCVPSGQRWAAHIIRPGPPGRGWQGRVSLPGSSRGWPPHCWTLSPGWAERDLGARPLGRGSEHRALILAVTAADVRVLGEPCRRESEPRPSPACPYPGPDHSTPGQWGLTCALVLHTTVHAIHLGLYTWTCRGAGSRPCLRPLRSHCDCPSPAVDHDQVHLHGLPGASVTASRKPLLSPSDVEPGSALGAWALCASPASSQPLWALGMTMAEAGGTPRDGTGGRAVARGRRHGPCAGEARAVPCFFSPEWALEALLFFTMLQLTQGF